MVTDTGIGAFQRTLEVAAPQFIVDFKAGANGIVAVGVVLGWDWIISVHK
jgi:hypothetical protein